jgi:hypothetical protein
MRPYLLTGLLVILCASFTSAQQQRGDIELGFQGFVITTVGTDYSFTIGTLQGKAGIYFTDNLEFGVMPSLSITTVAGETEVDGGSGAFVTYSFLMKGARLVPYAGAQYYKQSFKKDFTEEPGSVGVTAGVKYYFTKRAAFDVNANYLFNLDSNVDGGTLLFAFGLSFLL